MGPIQLSYSTFGLTDLSFADALAAVDEAGYDGVELSFHRRQFNPFELDDDALAQVRRQLQRLRVKPACMATASHFFDPQRPHEPSLMSLDLAGRKRRIDLVRRGVRTARALGVPLVSFGSGFIRDEHVRHPGVDPGEVLADSIRQCLAEIGQGEDITLLVEPEPGMFIETIDQGLALVEAVGSPKFRLHVDLCHAWCSEHDIAGALARAAPLTRYLHVSDAPAGYNLKIASDAADLVFDLDFASVLVYFPDDAGFLLVDRRHPLHVADAPPDAARRRRIDALLARAGVDQAPVHVDYGSLHAGSSALDDEIFTYLISVPGLAFDVLERARPILAYLRGATCLPLVERRLANTLTGLAHFHEIPGEGVLDFASSFRTLADNGFSGYATVELYHHVASWRQALYHSHRHLAAVLAGARA